MANDETPKKFAVDTMVEVAKQLITLSSGFIVLSVSLLDIMVPDSGGTPKCFGLLIACWIALVLSTISGLLALGAVAATAQEKEKYDVDEAYTTWFLRGQQVLFVLAFVAFVWFAVVNHGA